MKVASLSNCRWSLRHGQETLRYCPVAAMLQQGEGNHGNHGYVQLTNEYLNEEMV